MKPILFDQQELERVSAMARVFMKTDRVLSGSNVEVKFEEDPRNPAPSWTDGRTITFNKSQIGSVTSIEDIIRVSGLNYHELAHVLYTPRLNSELVKRVRSEYMFDAFNLLEDQRIETFLTSVYPSTVPYLVSTFMRFCASTETSWSKNFVLVHGRRYIPSNVRNEFRTRFERQDLIASFEVIIDEYRKLAYPADFARGLELIREYNNLLNQLGGQVKDPNGHTSDPNGSRIDSGRTCSPKDQAKASAASDDMDEELEDQEESDSQDDQDDSDDQDESDGSGNAEGAQDSDSGPKEDSDGEGEGGDSSEEGGGDTSSPSSSDTPSESTGGSSGSGAGVGGGSKDFKELLEDIAKDYEQSEEVQDDVRSKQRTIVNNDGETLMDLQRKRCIEQNIFPSDMSVSRRFSTILERLRVDSDPGWERRTSSGRINVQRIINDAPMDEIWDRWQDGNSDAADIECVITIDVSGSMSYLIDGASRAMWVIKRSLESLNANITVISYSSDTNIVYDRNERASKTKYKRLSAQGGTEPRVAVKNAVRILEGSKKANKIFITITDGQWSVEGGAKNTTSEGMIELLGKRGITTALAYLGHPSHMESHKCQIAMAVNDPTELVGFAKQIVAQSMALKKGK
jgi:hypothetical protein